MADVQIAVIDQQNTEVVIAVPGVQGPDGQTGDVAVAQDGTAAQPGIRFENDTNTGIYRPGADQVAVATNGQGRLFVDASGNVIAGTASPTNVRRLHIVDSNPVIGSFESTGTAAARISFKDANTTDNAQNSIGAIGQNLVLWTGNTERLRITSAGQLSHIGGGSTGSPAVGFNGSAPSNSLVVTSAGLVGIGNSSPGSYNGSADDLVIGNHAGAHGITIASQNNTSGYIMFADGTTGAELYSGQITYDHVNNRMTFGTVDGTTGLAIDSSQRVGIGTTSPSFTLDIKAATDDLLRVSNSNESSHGSADARIVAAFNYYQNPVIVGSSIKFNTYNGSSEGERARIDSSGRLLVGTSTAVSILTGSIDKVGTGATSNQAAINIAQFVGGINAGARPMLNFQRTGGSQAAPTANNNGDLLGQINFNAYDGNASDFYAAAKIECFADAAHGVTDTPGRLVFSTTADGASSPTERMRITSDAYVRLASGTGGIQFNGDTAAANALDDYEEGTFTPTVRGTITAGTGTYSTQLGKYTKIGNLVTVTVQLTWTAHTGSGSINVQPLPFAASGLTPTCAVYPINLTFNDYIAGRVPTGQAVMYPYSFTSGASISLVTLVSAGTLDFTVTYYTS